MLRIYYVAVQNKSKNYFVLKLTEFSMLGLLGDELVTKEFVVGDTYYIMFMRTS